MPCAFRPPYGDYDSTTLTLAQQRRMGVWLWSADTQDWMAEGSGSSFWCTASSGSSGWPNRRAAPCTTPIVLMAQLRALPLSLRVLAMRELFRIPLLGRAMRTAGMIEVDRDSPDFRQIDQAAARSLAAGHSLLVYPEGTASPDGTIGAFKDGAFIIILASRVAVRLGGCRPRRV